MSTSPRRGRHATVFPEAVGQMGLITKPAVQGNLAQGHLAPGEQLRGELNPAPQHVGMWAHTNSPFEGPGKVRRRPIHERTQLAHLDRLGNVSIDVVLNPAYLPCQHRQ